MPQGRAIPKFVMPIVMSIVWAIHIQTSPMSAAKASRRNTRRATRVNFKVPSKISRVYENSPYYIGTKIWETLPDAVQKSDNVFVFKNEISKLYKMYKKFV